MPQTERQRKDSDGMKRNPVCEQTENRKKEGRGGLRQVGRKKKNSGSDV